MSDTIAAIATGNVISAIGIIRLSGENAIEIAERVFTPSLGGKLSDKPDRRLVLGEARDREGRLLDSCLCTVSRGPNSYTGEDTAELQCHGSPTVLRLVLESLFSAGARQALAGEFTKRAFLNGRMDLTQAEAVIDLIDSETAEAARNAAAQLGGAIVKRVNTVYDKLVDMVSHYDAVLDYPDEDVDDFKLEQYKDELSCAVSELSRLLSSFERGKIMKSGVSAAIVGRPNAGKSSLLNALLGYDRAIVTNVPGTTRDVIEEKLCLGGVLLRLSDTAGIRGTDDPVEQIGVDRARSAAQNASLVFAVFDGSEELCPEDEDAIEAASFANCAIAVINKCDLTQRIDIKVLENRFSVICRVSALDKTGLTALGEAVKMHFPSPDVPAGEILTNSRHADAVGRAVESLKAALNSMSSCCTPDIVLTEVETAMGALGELTGRTIMNDITERIFSRFCVGK